ncbi:MAG: hypothetical protein ACXWXQ_07730 [Actinomycetota bacterium]
MTDYVLLYTGGGAMAETEEARGAQMQAWTDWFGQIGSALKDGGNPFAAEAKTLASDGSVRDGVSGTPLTGYSIVTADSLDAATTIAKGCPVLQGGGGVTVYETFAAM